MNCANCKQPLSPQRIAAMPGETWCKQCVEQSGDTERIRGVMIYDHKTAPSIQIGYANVDAVLRGQRRGVHASLPMASKRRSERDVALDQTINLSKEIQEVAEETFDITNRFPATCHPELLRVSPSGLCIDCAKAWYEVRLRK